MGAQVYNHTVERLHYSPAPPPVKLSNRLTPAKSRLNRTKRQLFGSPKSDELKQFCNAQLQLQEEEKRKKWNFDFRLGKPMDGPLQWEQMKGNRVPVVTLTEAAHVIHLVASLNVPRTGSSRCGDFLSPDELMDERAERANLGVSVEVDAHDESLSSTPSTLSPALSEQEKLVEPFQTYPIVQNSSPDRAEQDELVEPIQTYPIVSNASNKPPMRPSSPKPSSSKGSNLKQAKIVDMFKKRKPRSSSSVPEAKKVRLMLKSSASPDNGVDQQKQQQSQQQQQQEASA